MDFLLPSLGADMDRARLNCWLVEPGDTVEKGQIIAEVETEKAVLEVECWHDGVIEELVIEPGPEWLEVGTVMARIRPAGDAPTAAEFPEAAPVAPSPQPNQTQPERRDRVKASPRARARAADLGVDLAAVSGTGASGMVTADDVQAAAEQRPEDRVSAMRRAIARSMARSKREIPHYYLGAHIDLHMALRWLENHNAERSIGAQILPAALLLRATALALRENPDLNGHWMDDSFHPSQSIHLGVAISLREGGLVAPALHDADLLDLDAVMDRLRDMVSRARAWRLRSSEMSDPTVTVTNLGDRGVETAFPVIIPPQVAIVGFGKVTDMPVALNGAMTVHPVVHATLAADHRVTDGHRGGLFLSALDRLLQEPEAL